MITAEALERVLNLVKSAHVPIVVREREKEAIEEVEFLMSSYDDMYEDYDEDELC